MPSSMPNKLSAQSLEELQRQLNFIIHDIYGKLDEALGLDNRGSVTPLRLGGLGEDVSDFSGLIKISDGGTKEVTVGTGLEITASEVLQIDAQTAELDVGTVTGVSADTGLDPIDRTTFNANLSTMITQINAIGTKLNNLLAKLRLSNIITP
jgi:hypothetical protein